MASDGTVVVGDDVVVVAPFTVTVVFGTVVVTDFVAGVPFAIVEVGTVVPASMTTLFLPTVGATVVAIGRVVVTIWVLMMGRSAPFTVVFKLARPWNTARIFFEVSLSKSGTITDASSMTCPIPGIV